MKSLCPKHNIEQETRVVPTDFSPRGVSITLCPKCDRISCKKCDQPEMTGSLDAVCCGKKLFTKE